MQPFRHIDLAGRRADAERSWLQPPGSSPFSEEEPDREHYLTRGSEQDHYLRVYGFLNSYTSCSEMMGKQSGPEGSGWSLDGMKQSLIHATLHYCEKRSTWESPGSRLRPLVAEPAEGGARGRGEHQHHAREGQQAREQPAEPRHDALPAGRAS